MRKFYLLFFLSLFPFFVQSQTLKVTAISCDGTVYEIYSDGTWKKGQTMESVVKNIYYGGSASAKVKTADNTIKIVEVTTRCVYATKSEAKESLRVLLESKKGENEVFITEMKYEIDMCPK